MKKLICFLLCFVTATFGLPLQIGFVQNAAGGGASAFTLVSGQADQEVGSTLTFPSNIGAGHLLLVTVTWENSGSISAVTEDSGGSFTSFGTAAATSGNGKTQIWYLLISDGGSAGITVTNTGTVTDQKVTAAEFSYGGTPTFVASNRNQNDSSTTPSSGNVTNSGSFRLNWGAISEFDIGTIAFTVAPTIAGSATTVVPAVAVVNTVSFYNTVNVSAAGANATFATGLAWNCAIACFAAN